MFLDRFPLTRLGPNRILPTIKDIEEVEDIVAKRLGWFVVYPEVWMGAKIAEPVARYRRAIPRDYRARYAFRVFGRTPREVALTVSYLVETYGATPEDVIEIQAEVEGLPLDLEKFAAFYFSGEVWMEEGDR